MICNVFQKTHNYREESSKVAATGIRRSPIAHRRPGLFSSLDRDRLYIFNGRYDVFKSNHGNSTDSMGFPSPST